MHADTFETVRAANPFGQNAARRRVVIHNGNSDAHGLYFSLNELGKIVVSFHYTGLRKNVLVLSERNSAGGAAQISFRHRTSWQRRAELDAVETERRTVRGVRPVERQHGRIGDEDVAPLLEVG